MSNFKGIIQSGSMTLPLVRLFTPVTMPTIVTKSNMNEEQSDGIDYPILENVLTKINRKFIALPEDEVRRNNHVLKIVHRVITRMKARDPLFSNLYRRIFYGGSFYDGLKVGNPCEYDLDCLLALPKFMTAKIVPSDLPGFVHIELADLGKAMLKKRDEAFRYRGIERLVTDNQLSTVKVLAWMEGLVNAALNDLTNGDKSSRISRLRMRVKRKPYSMRATLIKAGPALTLKIQGQGYQLDVDLVVCFEFSGKHWPQGYRPNPVGSKDGFFVVPKCPKDKPTHWRLSFQEQERELLSNRKALKPALRLLKKLRDQKDHSVIASYYIKTVFLWQVGTDDQLWEGPLSIAFIKMLEAVERSIRKHCIPYYWNQEHNLLGHIKGSSLDCVANHLANVLRRIRENCNHDPYILAEFLLSNAELVQLRTDTY